MKTKDMKTACKRVKAYINNKPSIPILSYVKLDSNGDSLAMTGYDMDNGITITLPGACAEPFATCIRFADMEKIVGKLKSDNMDLSTSKGDLTIQSGGLSFTLRGRDVADYPMLPEPSGQVLASTMCDYGKLAGELGFILKATSHDLPRNFTSGVFFDFRASDYVVLVGTDGRRLHRTLVSPAHYEVPGFQSFVVPVKAFDSIIRLNAESTDTIVLSFHEDLLCWRVDDAGMSGVIHLMDTPYPDYWKVIPELTNVFKVECKPTVQALDALSIIAHERDGRDMVVVNANGRLNLSVKSESTGEAHADLPLIPIQGASDILVALNVDYLTDILKVSETVTMSHADSPEHLEPVRFDYPESDRIAVLMPVRLPA